MDRQDIDALLIGALYGELTPADEARLSAHLESHPGDRGALDDLKSARAKVVESRIFEAQLEPPQHISALLLQEAHRRAPTKAVALDGEQKQSWFWRFARSFMLHPAMAAAAMLVVVLGVGAIMYKNKGADFDKREYKQDTGGAAPTVATTPAPAPADQGFGQAAGSAANAPDTTPSEEGAYNAELAEQQDLARGKAEVSKETTTTDNAADRWRAEDPSAAAPARQHAKAPSKNKDSIQVTTDLESPKDFGDDRADSKTQATRGGESTAHAGATPAKAADSTTKADRAGLDYDGAADDTNALAAPQAYAQPPSGGTAKGNYAPSRNAGATGGGGAANGIMIGGDTGGGQGGGAPGAAVPPASPSATPSTHVAGPSPTSTATVTTGTTTKPATGTTTKATTGTTAKATATNRPTVQPPPPPAQAPALQQAAANDKAPAGSDKAKVAESKPAPTKPTSPTPKTDAPKKIATETKSGAKADDSKKVATQKPAEKAPAQATTPPTDSTLIGWAKQQHAHAVSLAKNGDCKGAAQVALQVSSRAPDYYASYMASDRQLKSCKSYIDDARDRDAEKSAKSRAQKRVNADEAPTNSLAK